jgi:hypothetical protein
MPKSTTLEIILGVTIDDEMYAAAADGLSAHAPAQPLLTWETFTDPMRWWLVPGPDDDDTGVPIGYKAEFTLIQTLEVTIKANVWYRPDLRSRETSEPHTHPWEVMEAHPVLGGYEDEHWHRTAAGGLVEKGTKLNVLGSVNRIFARDYHEVTSIAEPGRTVSVMVCGRWIHDEANRGVWGHLDLRTGCHVPAVRDKGEQQRFRQRLLRINPHQAR